MQTLIELFDREPLENAAAPLLFRPEKVVYLGCGDVMRGKEVSDLRRFFEAVGMRPELEFIRVDRYDRDEMEQKILGILQRNVGCCFDLTGGSELLLVSVGELSRFMGVSTHTLNLESQNVIAIQGEPPEIVSRLELSCEQNILLHGGKIRSCEDRNWDVTDRFVSDVKTLWSYCREMPDAFNRHALFFSAASSEDGLSMRWNSSDGRAPDDAFLALLRRDGFLTDLERGKGCYRFRYRDSYLRRLFVKAGNLLEVYVYLALLLNGGFSDVRQGVTVDWDAGGGDSQSDTKNEIDVMATRGFLPAFISCKNGAVKKEALYELESVSDRFGGRYAVRALIATASGSVGDAYLKNRARDSGIELIDGAAELDMKTLCDRILSLF